MGSTTPASTKSFSSSPFWCMASTMSHPPMNSPLTYSCGIVGQELSGRALVSASGSGSRGWGVDPGGSRVWRSAGSGTLLPHHPTDLAPRAAHRTGKRFGRSPELLDALPQFGVLKAVEARKAVDALDLEDLAHGAGEAALGEVGRALHEEHDRVLCDGLRVPRLLVSGLG